jgi:hypothetical protein
MRQDSFCRNGNSIRLESSLLKGPKKQVYLHNWILA